MTPFGIWKNNGQAVLAYLKEENCNIRWGWWQWMKVDTHHRSPERLSNGKCQPSLKVPENRVTG